MSSLRSLSMDKAFWALGRRVRFEDVLDIEFEPICDRAGLRFSPSPFQVGSYRGLAGLHRPLALTKAASRRTALFGDDPIPLLR